MGWFRLSFLEFEALHATEAGSRPCVTQTVVHVVPADGVEYLEEPRVGPFVDTISVEQIDAKATDVNCQAVLGKGRSAIKYEFCRWLKRWRENE